MAESGRKTVKQLLEEIIATNKAVSDEVEALRIDMKGLLTILIEKKAPVTVNVSTSTANEIKEALKPIIAALARLGA